MAHTAPAPVIALNKVLLPTFGKPIIPSFIRILSDNERFSKIILYYTIFLRTLQEIERQINGNYDKKREFLQFHNDFMHKSPQIHTTVTLVIYNESVGWAYTPKIVL